MLIAEVDDYPVDAKFVEKGLRYRCPLCKRPVVLRRGLLVAANFGHKPRDTCSWAKGETRAHLDAKRLVYDEFEHRGGKTKLEHVVDTLPGDRRADVMAWSPEGPMVAFELQHTAIDSRSISVRAAAYARIGVWQIWIPFLRPLVWRDGRVAEDWDWKVQRYPARPFERWIYTFGLDSMWMYDPEKSDFWSARMAPVMLWKEESMYYGEGGEENYRGGYQYESKIYRELTLRGPYKISSLRVRRTKVPSRRKDGFIWPKAVVAYLEPIG
ncbi:hypothetical protein FJ492_28065 [Mesorhizobium sp. B2-5-4]|uniref:competence protein CoiA family protein n=1 Tax=Mesorhizobium sp. B2-5-4 TaxID=2589926 RepID=UPI00112C2B19|nr:competence protein CoiA family protein [Mesorhizobium sp. B2-5-4]TPK32230.1 hypothetical protein FJ492_28065 [Mesorhizobium sp. B2-5-4]